MPLTLYRYILREMLKLLAVAAAVLVVLLGFGSTIKPLSDGLLGPWQVARVVIYTIPGMLPFALPFAAAFASTLVFFRMSQDNEITAWAVSGLSYREILLPVLVLGLVLTLGLFLLSNWVVPRFWQSVAHEVEHNVAPAIVQQINNGQTVRFGRYLLYADEARDDVPLETRRDDAGPRPYDRLLLRGVAVGVLSENRRRLRADSTAAEAVVDLYRDPDRRRLFATMMLNDVAINDPDSGTLLSFDQQPVRGIEVPTPFEQEPKFLTLSELRSLRDHPLRHRDVRRARRELADRLTRDQLLRRIHQRLAGDPDANARQPQPLTLTNSAGQRYVLRSPDATLSGNAIELRSTDERPIELDINAADDRPRRRVEAEAGRLEVVIDTLGGQPRINLVLRRARVRGSTASAAAALRRIPLPRLQPAGIEPPSFREADIRQLMSRADATAGRDIRAAGVQLTNEVSRLVRAVASQLHERAAMTVNCLLVLLLGAVMSMLLRQQMPLTIFFWCFMPTVIAFLTITTGENMMESRRFSLPLSVATLWAGNAALAAVILGVYLRLRRN